MIAELTQVANHLCGPPLCSVPSDGRPAFVISNTLVQNHPDQTTQTMSDGSNGLGVPEAYDKSAVSELKDASFGVDGGVRALVKEAPHLAVALR